MILYEDMPKIIVVVAVGVKKIDDLLLEYCRSSDFHGFKNMGGGDFHSRKMNILCLGGLTTDYSQFGLKSWPGYLFELFRHDNIDVNVLNGGGAGYSLA